MADTATPEWCSRYRGVVLEVSRYKKGAGGVPHGDQQHLCDSSELAWVDIKTQENRNANQPNHESAQSRFVDRVVVAGDGHQHDCDERNCGNEESREGTGQSSFGVGQQKPWNRQLRHGVGEQRLPRSK
jgi:hypothetical protein